MKTKIKILFFFAGLMACIIACEKDENNGNGSDEKLVFDSLQAEKDTITPGETTKITATARGYKLEYHWSASAGDILGRGHEVIYTSSPCHAGTNEISCRVKDGHGESQTKTIQIVVR
jgi:hypothetical protein